jgi:hypothetical protein
VILFLVKMVVESVVGHVEMKVGMAETVVE